MVKQLRYTTFAPGELEARLRDMAPKGTPIVPVSQLVHGGHNTALLKTHCCEVRYPDGKTGDCRYERLGPRWHLFHFSYEEAGVPLPQQAWAYPLDNTPAYIEAKARELAASAYQAAIVHERQEYFQRASEPSNGSRKKNPALYRLTAGKAKEWAGKYALCQRSGTTLLATGWIYDTLDEANAAWKEKHDTSFVVGCCCRLNRAWELPRFNPLYALFDPRCQREPELRCEPASLSVMTEGKTPTTPPTTEPALANGRAGLSARRDKSAPREKGKRPTAIAPTPESPGKENGIGVAIPEAAARETDVSAPESVFGEEETETVAFSRWMTEVTLNMEALYGLETDDLPDCSYADWFHSGMSAEDAAREAMALFVDA